MPSNSRWKERYTSVFVWLRKSRDIRHCASLSATAYRDEPEQASNLFQALPRLTARSHAASGNGLGLAISKRLVEMMGGDITLQTEEGIGSTFSFTIDYPLQDRKKSPIRLTNSKHAGMIVDDLDISRQILREIFLAWDSRLQKQPPASRL